MIKIRVGGLWRKTFENGEGYSISLSVPVLDKLLDLAHAADKRNLRLVAFLVTKDIVPLSPDFEIFYTEPKVQNHE